MTAPDPRQAFLDGVPLQPGDEVSYQLHKLPSTSLRIIGTVEAVRDDGLVTAAFPQEGRTPMRVTDRADGFVRIRTSPDVAALAARVRAQTAQEQRDLIRALWGVYDTWMNKVDCYDPGHTLVSDGVEVPGIASLLGTVGAHAMDAATDAVEPHEARIRELLAEDPESDVAIAEQMLPAGYEVLTRDELSLSSGCRRDDCGSCDFGSIRFPCQHDCHVSEEVSGG